MISICTSWINHFNPKLLRLIFELVRTPNIFSCTKLEMNLVWANCNIDVTSFAGIYRFDMQLLTIFSSKLELFNGSNVLKQTFRGEMINKPKNIRVVMFWAVQFTKMLQWIFLIFCSIEMMSFYKQIIGRRIFFHKNYGQSKQKY